MNYLKTCLRDLPTSNIWRARTRKTSAAFLCKIRKNMHIARTFNRGCLIKSRCVQKMWNVQFVVIHLKSYCSTYLELCESVACAQTFWINICLFLFCFLGDEETIPEDMASLLKASMGLWNLWHLWDKKRFLMVLSLLLANVSVFDTTTRLAGKTTEIQVLPLNKISCKMWHRICCVS